jgi:aspartate ammonia-lyase
MKVLTRAVRSFSERCVTGIQADRERCRRFAETSLALVTALSPHIGYQSAAEIAKESLRTGKPMREIIRDKGLVEESVLDRALDLDAMTRPGIPGSDGEMETA